MVSPSVTAADIVTVKKTLEISESRRSDTTRLHDLLRPFPSHDTHRTDEPSAEDPFLPSSCFAR